VELAPKGAPYRFREKFSWLNCLQDLFTRKLFTRLVFTHCLKFVYRSIPDYDTRLKVLTMESLHDRRLKTDLILFHKLVTNGIAIQISFPPFCDFYSTRINPRGIIVPKSTKGLRNDFLTVRVAKLYLKLPPEFTTLPLSSFTTSIRLLKVADIA
jgi:hypothetical protein